MSELYPLKFKPIYKEKLWGGARLNTMLNKKVGEIDKCGESWEISAVQESVSEVANGYLAGNNLEELIEIYMGELVGDKVYEKFSVEFPLLLKYIDANDDLSIQVHPNDKLAKERHNAFGKTETWVVIDAEEGAELITGFNTQVDKAKYLEHFNNGTLLSILKKEKVAAGDVFFIPAGMVHAIGKGILLAEIQQTSDVTYRIFDYDRKDKDGKTRELHTDFAIDAIDYKSDIESRVTYDADENKVNPLVSCEYFTTNILNLTSSVERDIYEFDSFVIYMCLEGEVVLSYNESESTVISKGETVLVPASLYNYGLIPRNNKAKLLEVYIK